MAFSNIIGQEKVKQMLHQMVHGDRLPHALLFLGPSGSGKLALALALAQYLLCENRQDSDSCGQCPSCSKSQRFIHPDLHFSFPSVGTNVTSDSFLPQWRKWMEENPYLTVNEWLQSIGAENRQGNINKEECAAIIRKLSLKIFEGSHKILVMWLPEYLGKEGNRLLKLIEEPPEDTIFILVAENQELILNTILSVSMNCSPLKAVPSFLRRKIMSVTTSVFALLKNASLGNRIAPIKSALSAMYFLNEESVLSIV